MTDASFNVGRSVVALVEKHSGAKSRLLIKVGIVLVVAVEKSLSGGCARTCDASQDMRDGYRFRPRSCSSLTTRRILQGGAAMG